MNNYYILSSSQINFLQNNEIVGNENTIRWNNNKSKFICKTKLGVENTPYLNSQNKFTHSEILIELKKAEWQNEL